MSDYLPTKHYQLKLAAKEVHSMCPILKKKVNHDYSL